MPEKEKKDLYALDKDALVRLEKAAEKMRSEISPLTEPIERSAQLTEADYSIRINARD
jgi:hypothetical protein